MSRQYDVPNRRIQRTVMIHWGHKSPVAGLPGTNHTVEPVSHCFLWPHLRGDIEEFVHACTVRAAQKSSNRGPQFTSKYWKVYWAFFETSWSLSSGYHPQSSGQTERVNQEVETYPCCMVFSNPRSWRQRLSWEEIVHNSLWSSSTGMPLFDAQLGYIPTFFSQSTGRVRSSICRCGGY